MAKMPGNSLQDTGAGDTEMGRLVGPAFVDQDLGSPRAGVSFRRIPDGIYLLAAFHASSFVCCKPSRGLRPAPALAVTASAPIGMDAVRVYLPTGPQTWPTG